MDKEYKVIDGTSFDARTPDAVCSILNHYSSNCTPDVPGRLRVFYGDAETGRDWMEEYDTIGEVGRSCGAVKVPLLIKSARPMGGGAILDHCIVRITADGADLYRHPKYHQPEVKQIGHAVFFDGVIHAHFTSASKARRYAEFITGQRNTKGGR